MTAATWTPSAAPARWSSPARSCSRRAAAAHLGLDVGEAREHGVDVAGADRLALREHEAEQAAGGRDLRVEVDEQLGFEGGAHEASFRRAG